MFFNYFLLLVLRLVLVFEQIFIFCIRATLKMEALASWFTYMSWESHDGIVSSCVRVYSLCDDGSFHDTEVHG